MPLASANKKAAAQFALPDADWIRAFRRRLLPWYRSHHRDMPWRRTSDPYCVWVSEIMLQQTQVATVIPYYERFLASFPDVAALAAADEHEVLRHWEGLGYYRRARQLHRAARQVVAEHGGSFPTAVDEVRKLAGIGRYTAGAIVSIAFDTPAPILEANTVRLYSRLIGFHGKTGDRHGQELLWRFAEGLLPRRNSGMLNQALMELGSQVCTPRAPRCEDCPARELCVARQRGLQESIPLARAKPRFEDVLEAAAVVSRGPRVLLRRHAAGERWAGLWDFPRFALDDAAIGVQDALVAGVQRLCGIRIEPQEQLTTIKHGVTRFRITLACYRARYVGRSARTAGLAELAWVRPSELQRYALSTSGRRIARLLAPLSPSAASDGER